MKNKTTLLLAIGTLLLLVGIVVIGAIVSQPPHRNSQQTTSQTSPEPPKPSQEELAQQLVTERPSIVSLITATYPDITKLYTIDSGALYDRGQWYGTTLTYSGDATNADQRDTLRILLEKKNGEWILRTNPPQPLLNIKDLPDVSKSILDSINKPAPLPAAGDSPAITPTQ